jgi:hypothetical protein
MKQLHKQNFKQLKFSSRKTLVALSTGSVLTLKMTHVK